MEREVCEGEGAREVSGERVWDGFAGERRFAHLFEALRGLRRLVGKQRRVRRGRFAGGEQADNLLELQRRVRGVGELHIVDGSGNGEDDVNAFGLRFEADVQDRFDAPGIVEGNGTVVDGVGRAEENQVAFGDGDAAERAGLGRGAADAKVRIGLDILRDGSLYAECAG